MAASVKAGIAGPVNPVIPSHQRGAVLILSEPVGLLLVPFLLHTPEIYSHNYTELIFMAFLYQTFQYILAAQESARPAQFRFIREKNPSRRPR